MAVAAAPYGRCGGAALRGVPLALQNKRNECGLACLAMVVGFYDRTVSLADLRRRFPGFEQGATLKDLVECARALGFASRGLRAELDGLKQVRKPVILHWNMDHFVVLVSVNRRGCIIHDPGQGKVLCLWSEVNQKFTGVLLELWRERTQPDLFDPRQSRLMSVLKQLSAGSGAQIAWVCVLSALLQIMLLAVPWHVQWTVDEALLSADRHLIGVLCFGFGGLLIARILTHYIRGLMVMHLGHLLSFRLACAMLRHILHLPITWFDQRHLGDIASRFASLGPLRDLLTHGAAAILVDSLIVVLSIVLMWIYAPALAAGVVMIHLCFALVQLAFLPKLKRAALSLVSSQALEQSHLLESVQAILHVKVYACEDDRLACWQRLHTQTLNHSLQLQSIQLMLGTGSLCLAGLEVIVLIYFAAHQVLDGLLTVGMFFALMNYRGYFAERLRGLVEQLVNLSTLQVHVERVCEVWDEPGEDGLTRGMQYPDEPARLRLCQVGVQPHVKQPYVFQDLNLEIQPGEFVAIIGASGAGKTTLLKLLMGLTEPSMGRVEWGDVALREQACAALRRQTGCVLQGQTFFSGNILDNIVLAGEPDMNQLWAWLSALDLTATLRRLPMGLYTPVGDLNSGLSSGEMQRLLLVRALYKQPNYLFLDEGTANLDADSSVRVRELLKAMQCTRVVVSHDLTFASAADRVYLLSGGCLKQVDVAKAESRIA